MKYKVFGGSCLALCVIISASLAFSGCGRPSWIDAVPSTATLHVTQNLDVVHHWYGDTHFVSYTMSNGITDNSDNPSYSDFPLSLNDKEVTYRMGFNGDSGYHYIRLYRGEIYMDFGIDAQIERGPKKADKG